MQEMLRRRNTTFAVAAALGAIVVIAFFRPPDTLVTQIEHRRLARGASGDWIYRLLALVAVLQAVYGGAALRTERLRGFVPNTPSPLSSHVPLIRSLARNAAIAVLLTLAYGLAAFSLTGGRASFWLFVVIAIAQWLWYFRGIGKVASWLALQPVPVEEPAWAKAPPPPEKFVPPLARGLALDADDAETANG